MTMNEAQMKQLRDQVEKREAEISTLKQHLALLTSDFKYNLKLLEDRDFELDQTEAQLEQIKVVGEEKEKEMEVLNSEIVKFKAMAERDAEQIRSLGSTLSQYKESVRSVRQRLEEALQLRDQELSCHRSELEALKTKIHEQSESLKVQEKDLSDSMKACERTWSQRYSECHKTVLELVAEQESLLKEKLSKDREMDIMQSRVLELQKSVDELTAVTDTSREECTTLTGQLEALQEHAATRLKEMEEVKQNLERNLRMKILEEYDGKIAELLAQLQSIEYAVSLERRESNTRLITLEAQQVEKMTSLHQTVQELRAERNDLQEKVGKLEKEGESLRENLYHLKNNGRRLSQKEESLTQEVTTLQHSLLEAKTKLEKTQMEKTQELAVLHDSLREARDKEKLLLGTEGEQMKRIGVLEQLLEDARSKVEKLSKKESEENREIFMVQEALEKTRKQLHMLSQKNSEQLKEIASLRKSLTEARNEGAMLSKAQAEHIEELAILKQSLYDARTTEEIMSRNNEENTKDLENFRQLLNAAKIEEDLMKKKLEDQATEILTLHDALRRAEADGALLMKAEAAHTEEISVLRSALKETQKQAEAASKHAQHLEAIIEVTQAETRRRVEIKECVSSLLPSAQDQQEHFCKELSDSPDELSTHMMEDSTDFNNGYNARELTYSSGCKIPEERALKTQLEEENRYLKARVEELQGENSKVGQVISELRNELETVGLLQPSAVTTQYSSPEQRQRISWEDVNIRSQRQAKMPTGTPLKKDPHATVRSRVVDIPRKEDITFSEKEELLTLRALLKDVHDRNALFYKQVASMKDAVPAEKVPERRAELLGDNSKSAMKSDLPRGSTKPTICIDRHLTSTELVDTPRVFTDEMRNSNTQSTIKPSTCIAITSCGVPESSLKRIQAETKTSSGVSAEVLKLNEQIARVRQQLTSLCSSEQSFSSCQRSSEEATHRCKSRYSNRKAHTSELYGSGGENEKVGGKAVATKRKGEVDHKNSFVQHNTQAREDRVTGKAPRSPKYDHPRKQQFERYLEEPAGKHTKRSSRKSERQRTEVILPSKHTASRKVRTPDRDSLDMRGRLKVGRKIRVKIPSDTSSRSDVVCSHCQECMSEECCQDSLEIPEMSYTEPPKPKNVKERSDPKCSHLGHGHASVFTSFGSEVKDAKHDDVRKSQYQGGTWSDTDESESTSVLQHTCSTHHRSVAHVDRRKPSHKSEDRIQARQEENVRASHVMAETVLRKQSSSGRKRGLVLATATDRSLKVEKCIPAIPRERVAANQSRGSPPRSTKVHY